MVRVGDKEGRKVIRRGGRKVIKREGRGKWRRMMTRGTRIYDV